MHIHNACRGGKANGGDVDGGDTAEDSNEDSNKDSNSDKISKTSNGNIVNGDIDDEGGGDGGKGGVGDDDNGEAEHVAPMESS